MVISLENFIKILDFIKENYLKDDKFSKDLNSYFSNSNITILNDRNYFLIEWLEDILNDKDKMIEYYIFELDWGKRGKDCIFIENKTYSLKTYKDLYYYLINYEKD